ncbi:MAG: ATP-grasp domain-containing protein [Planctomycetota bacterium]
MKIVVLTHLEKEGSDKIDPVVRGVADELAKGGHEASILAVHADLEQLVRGLTQPAPDLVFNLMETFGKHQLGLVGVAGLLDLIGVPYVGCGPGEFYLQEDKGLSKKLLAFDGIRYPEFAVFGRDLEQVDAIGLRMPLIVKPLRMDASIGIDAKAIVSTVEEMRERVAMIHKKIRDAALVEEYIEGREFYVSILGNREPVAFPPVEIDFSGLPEGVPRILDHRAKWVKSSVEFKGTKAVVAQVPEELDARLRQSALAAYRALRVRDYGRIDMRLTNAGELYVIEVNASCYLQKTGEFAMAAAAAGIDYTTLVNRIVEVAMERRRLK